MADADSDETPLVDRDGTPHKPRVRETPSGNSCRTNTILVLLVLLSPVIFSLVVVWGALGYVFTVHPYVLAVLGILSSIVTYIICGYTVDNVEPGSFFSDDFSADFDTSLFDVALVTIVCLFFVVWSTVLSTRGRAWCATPFFLFGMIYVIVKASVRKSWLVAETASTVMYTLSIVFQVALFTSALHLWVSATYERLVEAEDELLSSQSRDGAHGGPAHDGDEDPRYRRLKVAGISTIEAPNAHVTALTRGLSERPVLVLVHGYGGGNGLWVFNLDELSKHFRVYAVDWLGCGASDRPTFTARNYDDAVSFFVDGLEAWREAMGIERMVLAGHSMGGIICAEYVMRSPEHARRVQQLVMISPAGMSEPPLHPKRDLPLTIRIIRMLWPHLTPMQLMRFLGPFGPSAMRSVLHIRSSFMPSSSRVRKPGFAHIMADYLYHSWCLEASGEYAMHTILRPGVYSASPLCNTMTTESVPVPITFLYGSPGVDFMDMRHAQEWIAQVNKLDASVHSVSHAGHQLFMDNPEEFDRKLLISVAQTLQDEFPAFHALAEQEV